MTIQHRTMTTEALVLALDWAAAEGWNPGLEDAQAFHSADPDGFFIALDGDRPVAAISVVNHSDTFSFLGLYLCRPEWRGRGIGFALWDHALAHAGDRTIGLDGVEAQQANYAKSGFALAGQTVRYCGRVPEQKCPSAHLATNAEIALLIEQEAAASGWHKPRYLQAWFAPSQSRQTFVIKEDKNIAGAVTVRACRHGAKVGPLIARDRPTALHLLEHAASIAKTELIVDVPSTSPGLAKLCDTLGLSPIFQTARMYRGPFARPQEGYFGVTTLELG